VVAKLKKKKKIKKDGLFKFRCDGFQMTFKQTIWLEKLIRAVPQSIYRYLNTYFDYSCLWCDYS
jgi:hypothetical protein